MIPKIKRFYLIRHAKSSWENAELLEDWQRPLNKRGRREAAEMSAKFLQHLLQSTLPLPERFVLSPTSRTLLTAQRFADALQMRGERMFYDADLYAGHLGGDCVLQALHKLPDDCDTACLFGHNPAFGAFVEAFLPEKLLDLLQGEAMPTCAIAGFSVEASSWEEIEAENISLFWYDLATA